MAVKVIMPKQGLQMTEGTITKWLVSEGEAVIEENPLFEMETDKLNIEINAPASGILLKILRHEGEVVPITETIAIIGDAKEDITGYIDRTDSTESAKPIGNSTVLPHLTQLIQQQPDDENTIIGNDTLPPHNLQGRNTANERRFITPRAKMISEEKGINKTVIMGTGPDGLIIERDVMSFIRQEPRATPLAKKIAEIKDIPLSDIEGTGAGGKITKADVEAIADTGSCKPKSRQAGERLVPFTGIRKVISERMMQSLHNTAQANHRMKVDMSEMVRFREKLKAEGKKASVTDILVKIVAKALQEFPIINSSLTDEGILLKDYVNIGIAVAIENGLIVPVIKDAALMNLEEISKASTELVEKAKHGRLKPEEYTGGTFTVTNLGMLDVDEFTAIINPPESAILAVGKIERIPVAEADSIVIKPVMMLSLTYDHRVIDGAPAAMFLQRIKKLMQNPYLLI